MRFRRRGWELAPGCFFASDDSSLGGGDFTRVVLRCGKHEGVPPDRLATMGSSIHQMRRKLTGCPIRRARRQLRNFPYVFRLRNPIPFPRMGQRHSEFVQSSAANVFPVSGSSLGELLRPTPDGASFFGFLDVESCLRCLGFQDSPTGAPLLDHF